MQLRPEIPEDVKAEMDLEARRLGVKPTPSELAPERVPEDVRAEIDHDARVAEEKAVGTLTPDAAVADTDEAEPSA
jgi:hypothetical protein